MQSPGAGRQKEYRPALPFDTEARTGKRLRMYQAERKKSRGTSQQHNSDDEHELFAGPQWVGHGRRSSSNAPGE
jgi:hypothetical protein